MHSHTLNTCKQVNKQQQQQQQPNPNNYLTQNTQSGRDRLF